MREHWYRREGKTAFIHEEGGDNKTQVEHINVQPNHTGGKLDRNTTVTPDLKQEVQRSWQKPLQNRYMTLSGPDNDKISSIFELKKPPCYLALNHICTSK